MRLEFPTGRSHVWWMIKAVYNVFLFLKKFLFATDDNIEFTDRIWKFRDLNLGSYCNEIEYYKKECNQELIIIVITCLYQLKVYYEIKIDVMP